MHCKTCTCEPPLLEILAEDLTIKYYFPPDNSVIEGPRGVRLLHKPTGFVTFFDGHRSQLQNKVDALDCLHGLLVDNGWFDE